MRSEATVGGSTFLNRLLLWCALCIRCDAFCLRCCATSPPPLQTIEVFVTPKQYSIYLNAAAAAVIAIVDLGGGRGGGGACGGGRFIKS